ncbi:MAG: cation transporter, partial [Flavobacteriales bacterium]|nr:cation transporter [Flavobacteriales bacterium]
NAVRTLHQGTRIMMQAQPDAIGQDKVREALMTIPEVTGIHDQHTWTLDGTYIIHTVHVVTGQVEAGRCTAIKAEVRSRLTAMGIHHATIEMELPGEPCTLEHH